MTFTQIQRETAVDSCARAMQQAILSGQISPGERLPSERKLSASFGVTRVTVRGALARLAAARLLDVRQGSGYRVRDYRDAGGPDLIAGLLDATGVVERAALVKDLLRMRRALARAVLECFVEMGQVDASAMAARIDEMETLAKAGASAACFARADLAILDAIVEASGSAVLRLCLNPITQVVAAMPALCAAMYREPTANVAGYRALLQWCAAPDATSLDDIVQLLRARDIQTLSIFEGSK